MAHFIIYAADKPGTGLALREANRDAHLAFLKTKADVVIKVAGPWLGDSGKMRGSLLIVEADNIETVKEWHATDPYVKAELSVWVDIRPFIWAIGAP